MPAILERLVGQLKGKGYKDKSAWAIATSSLQKHGDLKKGTKQATPKGVKRGMMSPGERAVDRASKRLKHPKSKFKYNKKTNLAVLKRKK